MRGRMLTNEARHRLETAIGRRFPYTNGQFAEIYRGAPAYSYNFEQLRKQIQIQCDPDFLMSRDTLQRILCQSQGVDVGSIRKLFSVFGELFNEREDLQQPSQLDRPSTNSESKNRSDLSRRFCRLPDPTYEIFIGRDAELRSLLRYISPEHRGHIITIDGIGGVGKTTLVLEAAYLCWEAKHGHRMLNAPIYDAIVFTTFKDSYLLPDGVVQRAQSHRNKLGEIFRAIAETLEDQSITRTDPNEHWDCVYASLRRQRTLLIIDDLQTLSLEEQNEVITFLSDLPAGTKAVITTRKRRLGYSAIRLDCLSEAESLQLIEQQVQQKGLKPIDRETALRLHKCFWGIPVALVYAIGKVAHGYSLEGLLGEYCLRDREASHFCFASSVEPLRGKSSHAVLMALAIFHKPPVRGALSMVAGLQGNPRSVVDDSLAELYQLSLMQEHQGRHIIFSVTREYTLAELAQHPETEREMRERWVQWYINFAQQYGGKDWADWYVNYDLLQAEWENLLAVLYWCSTLERYHDVKQLWMQVNHFADLYGYWEDRLHYLKWLIDKSAAYDDIATHVSALSKKGWTLTMMGDVSNLKEAERLFVRAWRHRHYADLETQDYLAHNAAVLYIRQKRFDEAQSILIEKEKIVEQMQGSEIEARMLVRHRLNTLRDRAKIFYETENFQEARLLYQEIAVQAEQIQWHRGACYAHNMLANAAIHLGRWDEADRHLHLGLPIAKRNKNRRRLACYKRSSAYLERNRGNLDKAMSWAHRAKERFIRLGMTREADEMSALIEKLERDKAQAV